MFDKQLKMTQDLKTYVVFTMPRRGPRWQMVIMPVDDRDILKLEFPPKAISFYFYDAPAEIKDLAETLDKECNLSPGYLIATCLLSRAAAIVIDPLEKHLKGKSSKPRKGCSLSDRKVAGAVWHAKYSDPQAKFALTAQGGIEKLDSKMIVIDENKTQLWPKPAVKKAFTAALQKPIAIKKPLQIKPKPFPPFAS